MLNEAFAEGQDQEEVNVPQPCCGIRLGSRVKLMQIAHKFVLIVEMIELSTAKLYNIDEVKSVVEGRNGRNVWILRPAQAIPAEVIGCTIEE